MKTYLKINDTLYPATFRGWYRDTNWDNRDSIAITLTMNYETASILFVDGLEWSQVQQKDTNTDANGNTVVSDPVITDYSAYCVAGSITDNRNGTITVKMGKKTELEITVEERNQALSDLEDVLLIAYGGV